MCEIKVRGFFRLRNITIVCFYYLLNYYMFLSYDHLQAETYLLEITLLTLWIHEFLTSALFDVNGQLHVPVT
jgi:hypothetical protein